MTINLEDYIGKTVEVELRNGLIITGDKLLKDPTVSLNYKYTISSYSYYFDQVGTNKTHRDCNIIKIKELKEPEMTINLEEFVGKTVEIKHRDGSTRAGKLYKMKNNNKVVFSFPYLLTPIPHGGSFSYNESGRCCSDNISPHDAVEIKEAPIEPETMNNVIRSKIDVFTTEDERVEVTVDADGVSLTACGKGAREDLSIGSKDLAIAVAKAILEHYNVDLK